MSQMLYHALKYLIKNVRHNQKKDIHKQQASPEEMVHWLYSSFAASMMECSRVTIS
jgi:hypothetical protein